MKIGEEEREGAIARLYFSDRSQLVSDLAQNLMDI
jgi:hypothetical protein